MIRSVRRALLIGAAALCTLVPTTIGRALASDHLDSPAVIADPRADIGDLYAWMSSDRRRLNLAMTLVGHAFSDRLTYTFHIHRTRRFGDAATATTLTCRFPTPGEADCRLGPHLRVAGKADDEQGLWSRDRRLRVFAGLRDDPFFNNVKGTREAYDVAKAALADGTLRDGSGCPMFGPTVSRRILETWRRTAGGPAQDLLRGWTPASIVASIDLAAIPGRGRYLAVWAATASRERQIDRAGRPLTGNALLGTLEPADVAARLKEAYNTGTPADAARFAPQMRDSLALYDGFDGICGNALLADRAQAIPARYDALAALLADDRLWIDSGFGRCGALFAVERAAPIHDAPTRGDCGGRTPSSDAIDVYRSLLVNGTERGVDDGVHRDEHPASDDAFPFLRPATENAARD